VTRFEFLLTDVVRLYARYFEQCMASFKLTLSEYKVLVYLSQNENTTQSQLSKLTDTDLSTLGRIIDRMEQDGLIERHAHANDRRAHRLQLGPRAQATLIKFTRLDDRVRGCGARGSLDRRAVEIHDTARACARQPASVGAPYP
jgi:MarR family transcriptional regulator for hemolysin